ncbi:unnamed protein product [Musa hybrid cultivar]
MASLFSINWLDMEFLQFSNGESPLRRNSTMDRKSYKYEKSVEIWKLISFQDIYLRTWGVTRLRGTALVFKYIFWEFACGSRKAQQDTKTQRIFQNWTNLYRLEMQASGFEGPSPEIVSVA